MEMPKLLPILLAQGDREWLQVADGYLPIGPDRTADECISTLNKLEPARFDFVGGEPFLKDMVTTCMKVVINPSWKCQLHCPYCWLPHTKINRDAVEHLWDEWASALIRNIPAGSIVDVSGGDPLLYSGLDLLLEELGQHDIRWAITTNALSTEGAERLFRTRPLGCVVINVSDHSGNEKARYNIDLLRSVYPVNVQRCDHPWAGHHERDAKPIPYQPWKEGTALDGIKRKCNSGVNHWVIDPAGDIFRCSVDMQVANKPIGNLFHGEIKKPVGSFECDFGCSSCYTTEPHAWMIDIEERTPTMSKILLAWPPRFAYDIPEGPPLGLLYIAGVLRQKHDVWVLDFEALKYNWGQIEQRLREEKPDILGLSCSTLTFENMKKFISLARLALPQVKIMIGGPEVTSYPERSLASTGADCAVTGEAELVIEQVVDELIRNRKPGIVTGKSPEDLDSIPLPSIDLLEPNLTTYLGNMPRHRSPESMMLWSRGCPFNCFFCSDSVYGRKKPRYRSPHNIVAEIKRLDELGIKEIFVYDDDLVGVTEEHTQWLESVCNLIISEKLNKIIYKCQGRCSKNVKLDTLKLMKKAGFKCIMWGCESGSDRVLKNIRKGTTVEQIINSIKLCKKAKIEAWMFLMIGNYTETPADAEKTVAMVKNCKPDHVQVTYATPYPSDFEKFCIENDLIIEPVRSKWDTNVPVIKPDSMSVDDMIKYRKKIVSAYTRQQLFDIQSYFGRDRYVFRKWRRFRYLWQEYGLKYAVHKAYKKILESI